MKLTKDELNFASRYRDITENQEYRQLRDLPRHGRATTFDHCVRVARSAERLAPRFGVDPESAARVGLLHDFCIVNYYEHEDGDRHNGRWYCFYHPEEAVENSERNGFHLSEKERAAILSHMFPLTGHPLNTKLGLLLTITDKKVAAEEAFMSAGETLRDIQKLWQGKKKSVYQHSAETLRNHKRIPGAKQLLDVLGRKSA